MKVHDLQPAPGSRKRSKRVARGIGGKGAKTAGRGMKGQRARNTVRVGFEGGQMPLLQRIPKLKGFKNPFRVEYQAVNLDTLEADPDGVAGPLALHATASGLGALATDAACDALGPLPGPRCRL